MPGVSGWQGSSQQTRRPAEGWLISGILEACLQTMRGFRSVQPGRGGSISLFSPRGQRLVSSVTCLNKKPDLSNSQSATTAQGEGERRQKCHLTHPELEARTTVPVGKARGGLPTCWPQPGTLVSRANGSLMMAELRQPAFQWGPVEGTGFSNTASARRGREKPLAARTGPRSVRGCPADLQRERELSREAATSPAYDSLQPSVGFGAFPEHCLPCNSARLLKAKLSSRNQANKDAGNKTVLLLSALCPHHFLLKPPNVSRLD